MKSLAWSYSGLDCFCTCPRLYHYRYVLKIREEPGPAQQRGLDVHKAFELRIRDGTPLPPGLEEHEPFMQRLTNARGETPATELKVGLDRSVQPCDFFADNVWWRGVIDYRRRCGLEDTEGFRFSIVDYKTGRPHFRHDQLEIFALHGFAEGARLVDTLFYWTQTRDTTRVVFGRAEIPQLWDKFTPKLKAYTEAFRSEDFPPKKNGLCKKYCPVMKCEFNGRGSSGV